MSSGIAPANPAPAIERFDGSEPTGATSAAESMTEFLENEAREKAPRRTAPKAARREARSREDGDGDGDDSQAPDTRQPRRERAEAQDDDTADDPLHDPILDGHAPDGEDDEDGEGDNDDAEDGDDDDTEDADDSDDGDDDDADEDPEHDVTVNGVVSKVKLSELVAGYSREADYRQKTQALSADREEVENFAGEVVARAKTLDAAIQTYRDLITAVMPSEAEWKALKESNPEAYIAAQEQWGGFLSNMEQARADREALMGQEAEENGRQYNNYIKQENKTLLDKLPQLRNPKIAKNFSAAIFGYGRKMGYSDDEMKAGLINHRDVLTAYYASRYLQILESRQANSKKGQGKGKAPRASEGNSNPRSVQTPKGRRRAAQGREQRAADARLARSGSTQDAAAAFSAMFRE